MGQVIINDNFKVEVSDKQYTLLKKTIMTNKTTQEQYETWQAEGYFGNWESVLNKLTKIFIAEKVDNQSIVTLAQYKQINEEVKAELKNIAKQLTLNVSVRS